MCVQRTWRGHVSRRIANKIRLDNIVLGINVEKSKDVQAQQLFALFELSHIDDLHSPTLARLQAEMRTVLDSSVEYYDLAIHGAEQRFELPKHRDFLLSVLGREYRKEMASLKKQRSKEQEKEKRQEKENDKENRGVRKRKRKRNRTRKRKRKRKTTTKTKTKTHTKRKRTKTRKRNTK